MNMRAVVVAFLMSSTAAYAADAVVYEPAPEAAIIATYDWSGPYIGVQLGYGAGELSTEGDDDTVDIDGFVGGVYAGWNFQSDNIVYGIETDINYSGVEETRDFGGLDAEAGIDWYGSTRARVGLAADRLLAFATAGVAYAGASIEVPGLVDESETYVGWTAGVGLEYAFTDNLVGRGEYRYHDFGSQNWGTPFDVDAELHTGTFGISYKF